MLASKHFKLTRTRRDDWFNAILNADTQLFVDPFLIFKEGRGEWATAHDLLIEHFDRVFMLIASSNFNRNSIKYRKALDLLVFTEPAELCIGYTQKGTAGAGSGSGFAKLIAVAIEEAIHRGLKHPRHFEELGVFHKNIGADRISDITCTILKPLLVKYTQAISRRHHIPTAQHPIYAGEFDIQRQRWMTRNHELPKNPFTGRAFICVPQRFLRDLPVLNPDDWWNDWENQRLRDDINYEIMGKVNKQIIVETARRHPEAVRLWAEEMETKEVGAYDLDQDPNGVYQWDPVAEKYVKQNPLQLVPPRSHEAFIKVVDDVVAAYQHFVENGKGWYLLWDSVFEREKPELAPQLLFRGIAQHYCQANDISLDPEVNLGKGPVDFKFSNGYRKRAHLEIKKLHNGKFWNGLEEQLPTYMRSDKVSDGWFIAVRYRNGKGADERLRTLPTRVRAIAERRGIKLRVGIVDARPSSSASK